MLPNYQVPTRGIIRYYLGRYLSNLTQRTSKSIIIIMKYLVIKMLFRLSFWALLSYGLGTNKILGSLVAVLL